MLASQGAKVIALDICAQIDSVPYPMATKADLETTVGRIRELGGTAVPCIADVRDLDQMNDAIAEATAEVGTPDIVVANAGIAPLSSDQSYAQWHDVIAVNLTGVYHTIEACKAGLVSLGRGSVIITSSTCGFSGFVGQTPGGFAYTASKHAVLGLMKAFAIELGRFGVRVNAVVPGGVGTPMVVNDMTKTFMQAARAIRPASGPVIDIGGMLDPADISAAVLWLVSDAARAVTGVTLPVDSGSLVP